MSLRLRFASSERVNEGVYEHPAVIQFDATYSSDLQEPERVILELLGERLAVMDVLDIGIGAGRTVPHLLPRVRSYTGVDISRGVVDYCRARFGDGEGSPRFEVCDAQEMGLFGDDRFDFALFSFCGIDMLGAAGRRRVLREVARVLRLGGCFAFSTFDVRWWFPLPFTRGSERRRSPERLLLMNPVVRLLDRLRGRHVALERFKDLDLPLKIHYSRPQIQVKELRDCGFEGIRAFQGETGEEIHRPGEVVERWTYYLCRTSGFR